MAENGSDDDPIGTARCAPSQHGTQRQTRPLRVERQRCCLVSGGVGVSAPGCRLPPELHVEHPDPPDPLPQSMATGEDVFSVILIFIRVILRESNLDCQGFRMTGA